jgi:hypothetical protein
LVGTILRQALRPVAIGAVIGIAAAIAVSRILSSVLFGVSPADPIGLGGAALLVFLVALTPGVMAARPVTRADPTATLRTNDCSFVRTVAVAFIGVIGDHHVRVHASHEMRTHVADHQVRPRRREQHRLHSILGV